MDGEPKTVACADCAVPFAYVPVMLAGRELFIRTRCPACTERALTSTSTEEATKREAERIAKWHAICPPLYRDTDLARINPACAEAAVTWDVHSTQGVGLLGNTGAGKTRALFIALQRAFDAGKRCRAISHNAFSRTVQTAFSGDGIERADAKALLIGLQKCEVLMLDDLGKPPATDRADAELEEMVEVRTSQLLPILWSANGSSAWLMQRMGPDRGEPLVRRLSEFSSIPKL